MANVIFDVAEAASNWNGLLKALEFIRNNEVYVGIPDDGNARKEEELKEVTNAELLFIHTNGSPKMNIPPRPVIEPAIENDVTRLNSMMKKAAKFAFDGNEAEATRQLKLVGMRGQSICRDWFYNEDNGWPPDSPATIAAKMKGKPTRYEPRTLIDTSQMKNSIIYFVKTKGGRIK